MAEPLREAVVVLTASAAREQGISPRQFGGGRFLSLHHGVRVGQQAGVDAGDLRLLCDAASHVLPPRAAFSHETVLALSELPDARFLDARRRLRAVNSMLDVTVPLPFGTPRGRNMRGHVRELSERDVVVLGGLRVTTPQRTFLDLAENSTLTQLVVIGDAMLARKLLSRADLAAAVASVPGRRGVVVARQAVPLLDADSKSPMESVTRVYLVLSGLPKPRLNPTICDDWGGYIGQPDLYLEAARIALEYDGAHHDEQRQRESDAARDRRYARVGILCLRITAPDLLRTPKDLLDTVWELHEQRAPGLAKRRLWLPSSVY